MLCVLADHPDYSLAGDDLALDANLLYRCTDLHLFAALLFCFTQGLKPPCFSALFGTTEVMPCYKTVSRALPPYPVTKPSFKVACLADH